MRRLILTILTLYMVGTQAVFAQQTQQDDDILDFLPPILAATNSPKPEPEHPYIVAVKKISGTWRFDRTSSDIQFKDFIRLDSATAKLDGQVAVMTGIASSSSSFSPNNTASGGYDGQEKIYLVIDFWDTTFQDLASYYFFSSPNSNNASTDCHFYGDFQGNIPQFATCTPFTKTKLSNVQKSLAQTSELTKSANNALIDKHYQDYNQQKADAASKLSKQQQEQQQFQMYRDIAKSFFSE